jgi:hypothetical protein
LSWFPARLRAFQNGIAFSFGRIRALPPERGYVEDQPQQHRKTGRLEYA